MSQPTQPIDYQATLNLITFSGLAASFIGGLLSQFFKDTTEVEGTIRKRLTPAGWLALAISMVGLFGSVASELIRIAIQHQSDLDSRAQQIQSEALRQQELRWRKDTSDLLAAAKSDIERNLKNTIAGFAASNMRFTQTQSELLASKQAVLEDSLRHTKEIIVAGQPLVSLDFRWRFESPSPVLRRSFEKHDAAEAENSKEEQGGAPRVPYSYLRAKTAEAVVDFVAHAATARQQGDEEHRNGPLMLIPLDDARNAVLFFGEYPGDQPAPAGSPSKAEPPEGDNIYIERHPIRGRNSSSYSFTWRIDAAALPFHIDRLNQKVPSTSKMPPRLQIVLLTDFASAPIKPDNYAVPTVDNLWSDYRDVEVNLGKLFPHMTLELAVNGIGEMPYRYVLRRALRRTLSSLDDDQEGNCLVLEFDQV